MTKNIFGVLGLLCAIIAFPIFYFNSTSLILYIVQLFLGICAIVLSTKAKQVDSKKLWLIGLIIGILIMVLTGLKMVWVSY
jgi:4-hydroxybenzoate polyprenyltransferase